MGTAPPSAAEAAPRTVTGVFVSRAQRSASTTSIVSVGKKTTSGAAMVRCRVKIRPKIDVLVAVGFGQQHRVDHEVRFARRLGGGVAASGAPQAVGQRQGQAPRARAGGALGQGEAAGQQVGERGETAGVRELEGR